MNGITYFNPSEIIDDDTKPKILITDVYLQNTPIRQGMVSGNYNILNKPIIEADSINLSYQDNSFSLEFSSGCKVEELSQIISTIQKCC